MGSTWSWRQTRTLILRRDGYRCQVNSDRCTGAATEVDHILPKARGGDDSPSNLRAACRACNRSRGPNDW